MKRVIFSIIALLALAVAPGAHAQGNAPKHATASPKPLADTLSGEAKTLYDIARILYRDGDYASALQKFQRAFDLSSDARLLWNTAACEKNLRHYVKVLKLVDQYLKKADSLLTASDRKEAEDFARAIRGLVGELQFSVTEPGATVYLDDEPIGTTPMTEAVLADPGTRKIRVVLAGFKEATRTQALDGGQKISIDVELVKEVHEGKLSIAAKPGDQIVVDGKHTGRGQWSGTLPSGPHVVEVSSPGKRSRRTEVAIRDDEARTLDVDLEPEPSSSKWPWIVGGAVLVAGAAVGGYFLLRPSSQAPAPVEGTLRSYQLP